MIKSVIVGPEQVFEVTEAMLKNGLGCTDLGKQVIVIHQDQPSVGKHHVLFHELIHLACEKLKAAGIVKRQPSEQFVSYLAGALFPMLALSGLWNGVSPEQAREFLEMVNEEDGA